MKDLRTRVALPERHWPHRDRSESVEYCATHTLQASKSLDMVIPAAWRDYLCTVAHADLLASRQSPLEWGIALQLDGAETPGDPAFSMALYTSTRRPESLDDLWCSRRVWSPLAYWSQSDGMVFKGYLRCRRMISMIDASSSMSLVVFVG